MCVNYHDFIVSASEVAENDLCFWQAVINACLHRHMHAQAIVHYLSITGLWNVNTGQLSFLIDQRRGMAKKAIRVRGGSGQQYDIM